MLELVVARVQQQEGGLSEKHIPVAQWSLTRRIYTGGLVYNDSTVNRRVKLQALSRILNGDLAGHLDWMHS